jgi:hypothetical protein
MNLGLEWMQTATQLLFKFCSKPPRLGDPLFLEEHYSQIAFTFRILQEQLPLAVRVQQLKAAANLRKEELASLVEKEAQAYPHATFSKEDLQVWTELLVLTTQRMALHVLFLLSEAEEYHLFPYDVLPLNLTHFSPQERDAFYCSFFPPQRPRFLAGTSLTSLPHCVLEKVNSFHSWGETWTLRNSKGKLQSLQIYTEESLYPHLEEKRPLLHQMKEEISRHPYILRMIHFNVQQKPYWIAWDYQLPRLTLSQAFILFPAFSFYKGLTFFSDICSALAIIHRHFCVYGVLCPKYIEITKQNAPLLTHLETLLFQEAPYSFYRSSQQQTPEHQQQVLHPSDDVYTLGVLMYQILKWKEIPPPPLDVLKEELDALALPYEFSLFLLNCLDPLKEKRPQDASQCYERILSLLKSNPEASFAFREKERVLKNKKKAVDTFFGKRSWKWFVVCLVILVLVTKKVLVGFSPVLFWAGITIFLLCFMSGVTYWFAQNVEKIA